MPLNIYSTAAQLAALEVMPPEKRFFTDMFLKNEGTVEDEMAIYDYRKGGEDMAPFVTYGAGGVLMGRKGFQTNQISFPTIAPERLIESKQLLGRSFGEKFIGAMSPEKREKKILAEDLRDMRRAIANRIEWMVREVILKGRLEIFEYTNNGRNKNVSMVADFGFTQKYVPETAWDQPGAKIEYDMKCIHDMVVNEGLGHVDIIIMAPDVAEAMLENSKYIQQLNTIRMEMGKIETEYNGSGLRFLGWNSDGIEMWSFNNFFKNDAGNPEAYIPAGTLIAGYRKMLKSLYGPVIQIENPMTMEHKVYFKEEVPMRYADMGSNSLFNRLTSRPTIMPYNVDGWCVAEVL